MPRQRLYENRMPGVTVGTPRPVNVGSVPNVESAASRLLDFGLKSGSQLMGIVAKDYVREQQGHIDDAVMAAQKEFEAWKTEYRQTRQGSLALNAQSDYANKFAEISSRTMAAFGGHDNEIFRKELQKRLDTQELYAIRDGGQYQIQQDEAWQKSQMEGQIADFGRTVELHADDPERIANEMHTLHQSWLTKNPGMDDTAFVRKLEEVRDKGRLNALMARGDYTGAQHLLTGSSQADSTASGTLPAKKGTIAEDHKNPLNLKHAGANAGTRADFRVFDTYAQGFGAAWKQLQLYQNRDGLTTPRQMMNKWAPPSENDLNRYGKTLQSMGIDLDKPLDINDPKNAARLMKGMALAESPVGKRFSESDIERMLTTGQDAEGSQAQAAPAKGSILSGLSASDRLSYMRAIELGRQRQAEDDALAIAQATMQETRGLPLEERTALCMQAAMQIEDMDTRMKAESVIKSQLAFEAKQQEARAAADGRALFDQTANLDPIARAQALNAANVSPQARDYARELAFGKAAKENPDNRRALRAGQVMADFGQLATAQEREAYAMQHGLTTAQTNELLDYKGKAADLSVSTVQGIYKSLGGSELPDGFFEAVREDIPAGRKPSKEELTRIIGNLMMQGERQGGSWFGYGRDRTLFEARQEGAEQEGSWLPDVKDSERSSLDTLLEQQGLPATDFNRRKLKRLNMGLTESRPWEK